MGDQLTGESSRLLRYAPRRIVTRMLVDDDEKGGGLLGWKQSVRALGIPGAHWAPEATGSTPASWDEASSS